MNKKIIFQVTKAYMLKNRKRTLVTFLGILVMVILMTAVFVGKDTVLKYVQNAVENDKGSWHYQVYDIGKKEAEEIRALKSVDSFEISRSFGYSEFAEGNNPGVTPFLELKGYSKETFKWMNIKLKEGRFPEKNDELVISERALKEGADVKIGDTIEADCFERYIHAFTKEESAARREEGEEESVMFLPAKLRISPGETVKVPDHFPYYEDNDLIEMIHKPTGVKMKLTVVGIMEDPFYAAPGQGGYIAITVSDDTVNEDERVNAVFTIDLKTKEDCYGEVARILDSSRTPGEREAVRERGHSYRTNTGEMIPVENGKIISNDMLLSFAARGQNGSLNFLVTFIQLFFVILITAASLILIYNVFSMSYQERSRYLGMLSSVGATRAQKRWSVYYEVFSLLIPALPVGIGIGLLVIKGGMALILPYFSGIMEMIAKNIITGKSVEISSALVVNPVNIMLVVIFSAAAVYISAWIPAHRIGKVGPVESIRGNEAAGKLKKRYKSYPELMLKGKAEKLMGKASVERNRNSTRGIIRSITALVSLTLITAFATGSITDILGSESDSSDLIYGPLFDGYSYIFDTSACDIDEETYLSGRKDIMDSDEVSAFRESDVVYYMDCIPFRYYKDEYATAVKNIVQKWYPDAPEEMIQKYYLPDQGDHRNIYNSPQANIISMEEADFNKLADKAGIDLKKYRGSDTGPVLIYDTLKISSHDYTFFGDGAVKPDYIQYDIKKPLSVTEGEAIELSVTEYDEENESIYEVDVPVQFAGYVNNSDIRDYYTLDGNRIWIIMSAQTRDNIKIRDPAFGSLGFMGKAVYFNVNTEEAGILKRLSQIEDGYGRGAVRSIATIGDMTDFTGAIAKIANIVAVCFVLMIAVICLLNLYNSVMGRCLARHKELAVLDSVGMTEKQKSKMLMIENAGLLIRAFLNSAVIITVFVIFLHKLINLKYGGIRFSIPVGTIFMTALVSAAGLILFTRMCYRQKNRGQIIEELRMESV